MMPTVAKQGYTLRLVFTLNAGKITKRKKRKPTGDCDFKKKHVGDWKQKHSVLDLLKQKTKKSKFLATFSFTLKKIINKKTTE